MVTALQRFREQDPSQALQEGLQRAQAAAVAASANSSAAGGAASTRTALAAEGNLRAAAAWFDAFWRHGLTAAIKRAPPLTVGVYQDSTMEEVAADAAACGFDLVQLHGDEAALAPCDLPATLPAIRVVHLPPADSGAGNSSTSSAALPHIIAGAAAVLLVDARREGQLGGGTGAAVDWPGLGALQGLVQSTAPGAARVPFIVAGGITAGNVQQALLESGASGVDVSSGVEVQGGAGRVPCKDLAAVTAYVGAAKGALHTHVVVEPSCVPAAASAEAGASPPTL
jgi:phosphoribosylanthranilate isomerase